MLNHWEKRFGKAHLVRYEDLIMRPVPTVESLLSYLGLDAEPGIVEKLVKAFTTVPPQLKSHVTSSDPRASIGRWQRELDPALQKLCTESFREALEGFGYEL